jgi:hypothetical protein
MRILFYLARDVERMGADMSGAATSESDRGLTAAQVGQRFGFSKHVLYHWREQGCVYLGGQKLRASKGKVTLPNQPGLRPAWLYPIGEVQRIADRRHADEPFSITDAEGVWLTAASVYARYGIKRSALDYYRTHDWPAVPGGKLRAKQVATPRHKARGRAHDRIWVYHQEDIARAAARPDGRTKAGRELKARGARRPPGPPSLADAPERPSHTPTPGVVPKPQAKRARGRPGGTPKSDPAKDRRIFDAWSTGRYDGYFQLARELGITRRQVERAIDRERHRRRN